MQYHKKFSPQRINPDLYVKINGEEISNTLLNRSPVEIGVTLTTDWSILFLWFNGYIYNPGVTT